MKKFIHLHLLTLLFCAVALLPGKAQTLVEEQSFEGDGCPFASLSVAFYDGCIPNWQNVSGTADIRSNTAGVTASDGSRYAKMYNRWYGACGISSETSSRSESVLLNYPFDADREYTIEYDLRWSGLPIAIGFSRLTQWILTDGRANTKALGSPTSCDDEFGMPQPIFSSDIVVATHNRTSNSSTGWITYSRTFSPDADFGQLWLRNSISPLSGSSSSEPQSFLFLDNVKIYECSPSGAGYGSSMTLAPSSDLSGNVSVTCEAESTAGFVNHWWDVFYAPGGSTSGSDQVPGNPIQCCDETIVTFSNNMVVNEWYYVKHGIWNDCLRWRESRKRFRVQTRGTAEEREYYIEEEDIPVTLTDEYIEQMTQLARAGQLTNSQPALADDLTNPSAIGISTAATPLELSNSPNPFSGITNLTFTTTTPEVASLYIRDMNGRQVAVLVDNDLLSAGKHTFTFSGEQYAAGVYYATLQIGQQQYTRKLVLLK